MARVPTPTRFVLRWTCQRESRVLAYRPAYVPGLDQADACTVAVPRQSWHRNIHGALVSGQGLQLAAAGVLETRLAVVYLMKASRHRCSLFDMAAMQVATTGALVYQRTREREESQQRKHESAARRMLRR
jgi:hypothetical protein